EAYSEDIEDHPVDTGAVLRALEDSGVIESSISVSKDTCMLLSALQEVHDTILSFEGLELAEERFKQIAEYHGLIYTPPVV
ncbi:MAG TPA: hypothetical protein VFM18_09150, partial [Methanosarcina sp.]|nr:hypothetical protein [Methanosarcina sp.]